MLHPFASLHETFGGGGGGGGGGGCIGVYVMHIPGYCTASSLTLAKVVPAAFPNKRLNRKAFVDRNFLVLVLLLPVVAVLLVLVTCQLVEDAHSAPCSTVPGSGWWLFTSTQQPAAALSVLHVTQFSPTAFR